MSTSCTVPRRGVVYLWCGVTASCVLSPAQVLCEEVHFEEDQHPLPLLALAQLLPPHLGLDMECHVLAGGK